MSEQDKEIGEINELVLSREILEKLISGYRRAIYSAKWVGFFPGPGQAYGIGMSLGYRDAYRDVLQTIGLGEKIAGMEETEQKRAGENYEKEFSSFRGR